MAVKKLTNIQKKLALVEKLIAAGYNTEKSITDMTIDQILSLDGLAVDEMRCISELQKAIKNHKVIAFFAGGDEHERSDN